VPICFDAGRVCDKNLALEELGDEFVQEFDRSLEVDYWYALENPPDGHVIDPRVEEQHRMKLGRPPTLWCNLER